MAAVTTWDPNFPAEAFTAGGRPRSALDAASRPAALASPASGQGRRDKGSKVGLIEV